jgi:futalosine hydrolase
MHILLVAATPFELAPLVLELSSRSSDMDSDTFDLGSVQVTPLITGVGLHAAAWHLGRTLLQGSYDLVLNAGIAGAFDRSLELGTVVYVESEQFGDLGVEEADGSFSSLIELGLQNPDTPPFSGGKLLNPEAAEIHFLPKVQGLSVNKVSGSQEGIDALQTKYPEAQIESMEGAAVFYGCLLTQTPFMEIRSISNYVEPRNREAWNLPLAIDRLNQTLLDFLETLIESN